jgi:hypothetical protein
MSNNWVEEQCNSSPINVPMKTDEKYKKQKTHTTYLWRRMKNISEKEWPKTVGLYTQRIERHKQACRCKVVWHMRTTTRYIPPSLTTDNQKMKRKVHNRKARTWWNRIYHPQPEFHLILHCRPIQTPAYLDSSFHCQCIDMFHLPSSTMLSTASFQQHSLTRPSKL